MEWKLKLVVRLGCVAQYLSCMHKALASIPSITTTILLRRENMGNNFGKEKTMIAGWLCLRG